MTDEQRQKFAGRTAQNVLHQLIAICLEKQMDPDYLIGNVISVLSGIYSEHADPRHTEKLAEHVNRILTHQHDMPTVHVQ